jgi:hypothetical protein
MNPMDTQDQGRTSVRWATEWPVRYRRFAGFRRRVAGLRQWLWKLGSVPGLPAAGIMADQSSGSGMVLVDSLQLACDAFQACRHGGARPEVVRIVSLLTSTLARVRESGVLIVRMPDQGFLSAGSCIQTAIEWEPLAGRRPLNTLSPQGRKLLAYTEVAADELLRLCQAGSAIAVRSVGYAMQCIPGLIRSEQPFRPESYEFCLRIAAYRWFELSRQFQEAICDLMDVDRAEIDRLAGEEGFAIDLFGYSPRGQCDAD